MLVDEARDFRGFDWIVPFLAAVYPILDVMERHRAFPFPGEGGEGKKRILVEAAVAEGDEGFIAGTIMPKEAETRVDCEIIEDGFEGIEVAFAVLHRGALEERGRGHLAVVPRDDGLGGAVEGPDRVIGEDLGSLVEDHDVESRGRGKVGRDA